VRLAGHTYPYRDRPLGEALDELAGIGLGAVEVWLGHAGERPDDAARAVRDHGLDAAAVSAGGFYTVDSDALPRAIELAEALDAPVIVACAAPEVLGAVASRIPASLTLCVENHWDQGLAHARVVRSTLAAHPRADACVDTGHAILAGERPDRFVRLLGRRVGHVHLKDAVSPRLLERLMGPRLRARVLPRPEPVTPGAGALDIPRLRDSLSAVGFVGTVSLEYEGAEPTAALRLLLDAWKASDSSLVGSGA
jgi:sugar phosphate isomerase/epimerase